MTHQIWLAMRDAFSLDDAAVQLDIDVPRLLRHLTTLDRELHGEHLHHTCGCGRGYSLEEWLALPCLGQQADDGEVVELRNCACGSTLAIELLEWRS